MSRPSDNPTVHDRGLTLAQFADTGMLWLVNRVVFHPRGFALAIHHDAAGRATGWSLLGDGSEPWTFDGDTIDEDSLFERAEAFLESHREVEEL